MKPVTQQRSEFRKAMGRRIALIRYRLRLTRPVVAGRCGVGVSCILSWEAGIHEPTAYNLRRLASALGVSTDELLAAKVGRVAQ